MLVEEGEEIEEEEEEEEELERHYEGEEMHGKWHGLGYLEWGEDGIVWYRGDFKHGEMTGLGIRCYKGGDRYEGQFFDGCRHGVGIMIHADGTRCVGEFAYDSKHGVGQALSPTGNTISLGKWEEGEFIESRTNELAQATVDNAILRASQGSDRASDANSCVVDLRAQSANGPAADLQVDLADVENNGTDTKTKEAHFLFQILPDDDKHRPIIVEMDQLYSASNNDPISNLRLKV